MHRNIPGRSILVVLACLLSLPLAASAQSSLAGLVRDESGSVLPGVTVEAASPVLIEKVRTNVTDEQGRYRLVDLRPGTYRMTFSLSGFSSVVREGVEVPANVTVTINADLKVGTLQETVTVTGVTPTVDVQQVARTQVVSRNMMDTLPTSRNVQSIGMLVPGVRMATPDIGGSRQMEQPSPRVHGVNNRENTQFVDGQSIQGNEGNTNPTYFDDNMGAEISLMTAAIPADTSGGGLRINVIPKDGGNLVSGAVFMGGSDGGWQSKNIDDKLRARNIASANGIVHIQNFSGTIGGPIKRDKLWFFLVGRHTSTDESVANVPEEIILPDGTVIRSILDQFIRNVGARFTWQATPQHKLAAWYLRVAKYKGKDFGFGRDPRAASKRDVEHGAIYGEGAVKWTGTKGSRWLFEGGVSTAQHLYVIRPQTEVIKERGTPDWYRLAEKTDTALNTNFYPDQCAYVTGCLAWGSINDGRDQIQRYVLLASATYVTGTHSLKVGLHRSSGPGTQFNTRNGDLIQNYVNNRPSTVSVFTSPSAARPYVNSDMGVYVQDTWTVKRLTLNLGLRTEFFNSENKETSMPAGRFAPARFFRAVKNLPNWGPDWAPRLSVAYDLFGTGRTALKASASRYYVAWTGGWAQRYSDAVYTSELRNWFDADLIPGTSTISGVARPTNGDGIAQDNEIGPSASTTFGQRADRNPAPGIKRASNWEYTTSVQHQVMPRVSVTGSWFHRSHRDIERTDRTLIELSDYTSFTTPMPNFSNDPTLSGILDPTEVLTVYNLNPAKRSVFGSALVDINSTDQSIYNGVEVSFAARLPRAEVFGGWTTEKNDSVFCSDTDNPNGTTRADLAMGFTVSNGGRFCDTRGFGAEWRQEFKLAGMYQLPFDLSFAMVLQSYPGADRVITWTPPAALFPGGRTNAETIRLTEPGALYQERYTQLDVNFKKNFRVGSKRYSVQFDLFNALNGNAIFATNNAIGGSLGQVQTILMGRLPRIAFQFQW